MLIPTLMMLIFVAVNTVVIQALKKKRAALDMSVPVDAARAKNLSLVIAILYIEIPIITAIIWLVVAPALASAS